MLKNMNYTVDDVHRVVNRLWPERIAESWDRVGLVVGNPGHPVNNILLAVDPTLATVSEAVHVGGQLLLTHHPLLLRGIHQVTEADAKGATITELIRKNIALIAAHTNADQPANGVSDVIAQALNLTEVTPLIDAEIAEAGTGRVGKLSQPLRLRAFAETVNSIFPPTVSGVRVAGDPDQVVSTVALCGGAGDSLLAHPAVLAADVYITSDLRHHPASEAREQALAAGGPALIDVAHWAAESLWLNTAARQIKEALPGIETQVSTVRTDPWDFSIGAHDRNADEPTSR
jgi:dinuclear metal center YbgI/SA1388 family protein